MSSLIRIWPFIRRHRAAWSVFSLIPLIVFAIAMLVVSGNQHRREIDTRMQLQADNMANVVEQHLASQVRLLQAIARLPWLLNGDFALLKDYLEVVRSQYPALRNLIVTDYAAQIFNLNEYPGTTPVRDPATLAQVVRHGTSVTGPVVGGLLSIRVPVITADSVRMTIVAVLHASILAQVFDQSPLPDGWAIAVANSWKQRVVAHGETRYLGSDAWEALFAPERIAAAGARTQWVLPGNDALRVLLRPIGQSDWHLALLAPPASIVLGVIRIDHLLYLGAGLATVLSALILILASRALIRQVRSTEAALHRLSTSEERFRHYAETASDWFWETDTQHRFTRLVANSASTPANPESFLDRTRLELGIESGKADTEELRGVERLMDQRIRFTDVGYRRKTDDDPAKAEFIELSGMPVFDAQGSFVGYRGTGRDVTVKRRQEAELARALMAEKELNQQQRSFIAIVSHEFRTPLAVIDGAAQRIMRNLAPTDPETVSKLERIRRAVAQLIHIMNSTLSSAQAESGKIDVKYQTFDLVALVRAACNRQKQIAPHFDIRLRTSDDPLTIDGDPRLLEQVIGNLLSNAVKYSARQPQAEVVVSTSPDRQSVEIAVSDHGVGIPADEIPMLFTRFFRARTAKDFQGTGIGLYLVAELVRLHAGSIGVASDEGKGTTFRLTLPRSCPARSAA